MHKTFDLRAHPFRIFFYIYKLALVIVVAGGGYSYIPYGRLCVTVGFSFAYISSSKLRCWVILFCRETLIGLLILSHFSLCKNGVRSGATKYLTDWLSVFCVSVIRHRFFLTAPHWSLGVPMQISSLGRTTLLNTILRRMCFVRLTAATRVISSTMSPPRGANSVAPKLFLATHSRSFTLPFIAGIGLGFLSRFHNVSLEKLGYFLSSSAILLLRCAFLFKC